MFSIRFYDIAWGGVTPEHPRGVIAGALESGALELWDAESLINGNTEPFSTQTKHTGAIKCLEFNPIQKNVIATSGANGEIYIWDLKNLDKAIQPGRTPSRTEDVEAIAWNNGVTHILATGSASGTSVWDLKNRKEVLHLSYTPPGSSGRSQVSSIAWHPDNSTTLITASSDETLPVILLWDLRNANAPQQIIQGHDKGVLSVDWCKKDSTYLLSSGKDNKTFLWDPTDGSKLGEYPVTSSWNFSTKFSPHYPDIFASASFDGKITVQTLQDTNSSSSTQKKAEGDDFWSSNNYVDAQHPVVSLKTAPKWLKRPASATFGFGGKIVSLTTTGKTSKVSITKFAEDEALTTETTKFAEALKANKFTDIISEHLSASSSDALDWELLELLSKDGKKTELQKYITKGSAAEPAEETKEESTATTDDDLFASAGGEDFLSTLSISETYTPSGSFSLYGNSSSKSDAAITKAVLKGDFEKAVGLALKEDSFSDAFALAANASESLRTKVQNAYIAKHAEAKPYLRVLSSVSSKDLTDLVENSEVSEWKEVADAVFSLSKDDESSNALISKLGDRLLATKERNDALLCYLAASNLSGASSIWIPEINEQEISILKDSSNSQTPYNAHVKALHAFIEKVTVLRKVGNIQAGSDKNLDLLYDAYREYANIVATQGQLDLAETYLNLLPAQYKGASVEKERVAKANNKAPAAKKTAAAAAKPMSNFAYPPVKQTPAAPVSTGYNAPSAAPVPTASPYGQPASSSPYAPAGNSASPYAPVQSSASPYGASASPYAPQKSSTLQPSSAYAPPTQSNLAPPPGKSLSPAPSAASFSPAAKGHGRTPSGIYPPPNPIINTYQPPQPAASNSSIPAPPPGNAPASAMNKRDGPGWNDLPTSGLPQSSRRATPAAAQTIANPFANQAQPFSPPGRQTPVPLAPPPSGPPTGGPSSRSYSVSSAGHSEASTPSAPPTNPYAPKADSPSVSRPNPYGGYPQPGADQSSYFSPPAPNAAAVAPPVNPYAAAAAATPPPNPYATPATNSYAAPPPNPYAASQSSFPPGPSGGPQGQYGPPPGSAPPQGNGFAPPPQNYPPTGAPASSALPQEAAPPPAPEPPVKEAPKYPPGDRSHIPSEAQPIYELLQQEMDKVLPKVPAQYKRQVDDIEKRLGILFDHLNNEDLLSEETVSDMVALSKALSEGDHATADEIRLAILTSRVEECGHWMAGIKRLVDMSRVIARA